MAEEMPLVCICVPTYNAAITVRQTLESILAQSYSNLIVHVSDNASSDETIQIVESMANPRIILHRNDENIGAEGNFNNCIRLAEGKYTAIFHADDIYEPDMVAKQVAFLEAHPSAGAVFTEASLIDDVGEVVGEIRLPQGIRKKNGLYDFETMFKAVLRHFNFFICPSFMLRTQIYTQEIKVWRGDLFGSSADLDVWLRVLQRHSLGHIPERLMQYRISNNQFSAQIRNGVGQADFFRVVEYYLKQDDVQSMLGRGDRLNYKGLERRDRLMRAINLFLLGRKEEAASLLKDIGSPGALYTALQSRRGGAVLLVGMYTRLLIALGLNRVGVVSLTYIKRLATR